VAVLLPAVETISKWYIVPLARFESVREWAVVRRELEALEP
jgi:hypothetical protein